jgi:hypothetical protein
MDDGRALDPAYVTRLFQVIRTQGEPLPELTFLGHSSISITADVYGHLIAGIGQRAVDGAAALIPNRIAHTVHTQSGAQANAG